MAEILVLYYSAGGSVRRMAELVAEGVERTPGAQARLRTVPRIVPVTVAVGRPAEPEVPSEGAPYAELADLTERAKYRDAGFTDVGQTWASTDALIVYTSNRLNVASNSIKVEQYDFVPAESGLAATTR